MARRSMDVRMQKTKQALVNAMIELLEQSPFSAITVNDICITARVGRSTFYTHFEDKYALVRYAMQQMKENALVEIQNMSLIGHIEYALHKVKENARMLKNLTATEFNAELMEMLRKPFCNEVEKALIAQRAAGKSIAEPIEITAVYYAFAISSSIMYWVYQDMPYSVEDMAQCLKTLIPEELIQIARHP